MSSHTNLLDNKIIVSSHIYTTGPAQALENYLKSRSKQLLFIGHPFVYVTDRRSYIRQYKKNSLVASRSYPLVLNNQMLAILKDIILTFILTIQYKKADIFIGVDSINAITGILLMKMGIVEKVVYYTIDYVPQRFSNFLLNRLYLSLDMFAVKNSTTVWNLSQIMVFEREKRGLGKEYRNKQILVPIGTELGAIKIHSTIKKKQYSVSHMGHLIQKQGVQMLISAIPRIVKHIPKFHLAIIGGGEYESTLKAHVKKKKIEKYVTFHGYIKRHEDLDHILSTTELGIAPYTDDKNNYVRYTDPGKVKAYLAAGLPVIITKVPEVYKYLEEKKCGIGVEYDAVSIANAIVSLLTDRKKLQIYTENATKVARNFTWEKIFNKAFSAL